MYVICAFLHDSETVSHVMAELYIIYIYTYLWAYTRTNYVRKTMVCYAFIIMTPFVSVTDKIIHAKTLPKL